MDKQQDKLFKDFELVTLAMQNSQGALEQSGFETLDELAKSRGYKNFVSMVVKTGPDPDTKDAQGKTALEYAAKSKTPADPNLRVNGQTPFKAASQMSSKPFRR
jgi:ankyrin repeat protein